MKMLGNHLVRTPDARLQEMKEYGFKLSVLSPIGFYLAARISFRYSPSYERKIRVRISELYGHSRIQRFMEIHNAQKLVFAFASVIFILAIIILGEVDYSFFLVGLALLILPVYWTDKQLEHKLETRQRDILIDLPGFLSTLTLLVNAGLPLTAAVQKIARESSINRPLYSELHLLAVEIQANKPVVQAFEDLAQRCKVFEVTKFVSAALQNLNRGNSDIVHVLRILGREAWDKRKEVARRQGEEASSKLVFPMVMVFVAVAIIVLAPAIVTMSR